MEIFRDSSSILKEKHPEVCERLLLALNISVAAKTAKVNWSTFLLFNSILKYFTATQKQFTDFWVNVSIIRFLHHVVFQSIALKNNNKN